MSEIQEILYNENLIRDARYIILALVIIILYAYFNLYAGNIRDGTVRAIVLANGKLKVAKRFKIEDRIKKIKQMGAVEDFPHIDEPIWFVAYHLVTGIAFGGLAFTLVKILFNKTLLAVGLGVLFFIIGLGTLKIFIKRKNDNANLQITEDVLVILNILSSQIAGGQYTGTALGECSDIVRNKRFKKAIEEFDRDVHTGTMTLTEAVKELEGKFNGNIDIDNLCMVLVQNEESGRSRSMLADLSQQIMSSERAVHEKIKQKLDRYMTYAVLILFADIAGYVMWLFINTITESINFTF